MKDKLKGMVLGVLISSLVLGGTVTYAATNTKLSVVLENIKYMFDGVHKQTTQSIIYNGTLYVPAKKVAQGFGESFTYDGKNKTAWYGQKNGTFKYLDEISYARVDGKNPTGSINFKNWTNPANLKFTIADQQYLHGIGSVLDQNYSSGDYQKSIDYNLNGKYKKLTGFIGVDDYTKNSVNTGTITIIGDGQELFRQENLKGGDMPSKINVDVSGVLKLQIKFESSVDEGKHIDLVIGDAKLY